MYFGYFIFSLTLLAIAIWIGASVDGITELSQADEYETKLRKRTIIAAIFAVISIGIAAVPLIDSFTEERIEVEVQSPYSSYKSKEFWSQTKVLKIQYKDSWDAPSTWYIWILAIGGGVYLLSRIGKPGRGKEQQVNHIKELEAAKAYELEEQRKTREAETQAIKFVTDNFGKPDKIIHTVSSTVRPDWSRTVFFVFDKELMYYNNRVVRFNEIISCDYVDNSTVETKQTGSATTDISTNTGSMLGRAVVGGVLAGGAGAIIGGATARQTGETVIETNSVSVTKHDYTVIVNTKNVRNPLLKIPCGEREQAMHDIVATLKAAIANNK